MTGKRTSDASTEVALSLILLYLDSFIDTENLRPSLALFSFIKIYFIRKEGKKEIEKMNMRARVVSREDEHEHKCVYL